MKKKMHGRPDRLRNKIYRIFGICPRDDFLWYTSDAMKVMESFEHYTKLNTGFNNMVAKQLGLVFDKDGKPISKVESTESVERGVYG